MLGLASARPNLRLNNINDVIPDGAQRRSGIQSS